MIRAANLAQRLANILAARGKTADFVNDCRCVDDSDGLAPRLDYWDAAKLGPAPTQAEVDAAPEAPSAAVKDTQADDAVSKLDRFRFEMDFAIENRVRVLEGKAPITRSVYLAALKAAWKAMP